MTFFLLVSRLTTGVIVKPSNLHSHFIRELEVGILFARSVGGYSKVKSRLAQESIAARGCEVSYFAFNVCILEKAFTITLMYGGVVMKQCYHFATILLDANTPPVVELPMIPVRTARLTQTITYGVPSSVIKQISANDINLA